MAVFNLIHPASENEVYYLLGVGVEEAVVVAGSGVVTAGTGPSMVSCIRGSVINIHNQNKLYSITWSPLIYILCKIIFSITEILQN